MRFASFCRVAPLAATLLLAPARAAALPPDCPALGDALVEHSCFHTVHGPFKSVQSTAGTAASAATPDLNAVHTEYRVGLAGDVSVVTYTPERSGAWTIFLGAAVPIRVFDGSGREVSSIFSAAGDVGCSGLVEAHVFEVERGARHRLVFGPTTAASVVAVVEFVDDFLIENGRDTDGDGFGTAADTVRSPCTPPSGYVQNTTDCDDENAALNPRAREICDGLDQNCNGLADDEGLECRVGKGECLVVGTLLCEARVGEPVRCSAEPRPPAAESCNGKDDDCDGVIDGDRALCRGAEAGPSCVREGFSASCGCSLDQDCGPLDSGRVCNVRQHRCVDGCSGVTGRNGCPEGHACVDSGQGGAMCVLDEPEPSVAGAAGATGTPIAGIPDDAGTSGCGCRVAARRSNGSMVFFVALLIGGAAVRRRFRRTPPVSVRSVLAAGILTLTGTSGCGGRSVSSSDSDAGNGGGGIADAGGPTAAAGAACVPALGASTVAHACSHTDNGPYVAIAALASSAPDISELHKTFSVLVVDAGAALMYRPKRHGDHVVLTDRAVTIDVVKQGTVEGLQGDPFPVEGCRSIVQAIRAELAAGEKYQLRVREPSQSEFKLFVEYPPAFGAKAWKSCAP
jgi:hypothetical protein